MALRLLSRWGISTLGRVLVGLARSRKVSWVVEGVGFVLGGLGEALLLPMGVWVWSWELEAMLTVLLTELEKPEPRDVEWDGVPSGLESSDSRCLSSVLVTVRMVEFMREGSWLCWR